MSEQLQSQEAAAVVSDQPGLLQMINIRVKTMDSNEHRIVMGKAGSVNELKAKIEEVSVLCVYSMVICEQMKCEEAAATSLMLIDICL